MSEIAKIETILTRKLECLKNTSVVHRACSSTLQNLAFVTYIGKISNSIVISDYA